MKTETRAFAQSLENALHVVKSQAGRNAKGSLVLGPNGIPQSDRFVKMTEFSGSADKTPKVVRDGRALLNSWALIGPMVPEFLAEVDAARAAIIAERKVPATATVPQTAAESSKKAA